MSYQPPPPAAPPPPPPPPPPPYSAPAQKGGRGCLTALAVMGVLAILVIAGVAAGTRWLFHKAEDVIGSAGPCPYLTNEQASDAVGVDSEAELFTGGLGRVLNVVDLRVLPDKESCIIRQKIDSVGDASVPGLGRTVKYVGTDAATLYDEELAKAKGTTEDRGNGLTVETQSYFNREVPGLGDRAFCVKSTGTVAGVVAIEGDTLVYVGITRAGTAPGADLTDPGNPKLTSDDAACDASSALARTVLSG